MLSVVSFSQQGVGRYFQGCTRLTSAEIIRQLDFPQFNIISNFYVAAENRQILVDFK